MTVRKWRSNSPELLATIPPALREAGDLRITVARGDCAKALGLHWDKVHDFLHVTTPQRTRDQTISFIYYCSYLRCYGLVLTSHSPSQSVTAGTVETQDEPLPTSLQQKWKAWIDDLPALTTHSIPRHMGEPTGDVLGRQLHGFCDASVAAYGGASYLRSLFADTSFSFPPRLRLPHSRHRLFLDWSCVGLSCCQDQELRTSTSHRNQCSPGQIPLLDQYPSTQIEGIRLTSCYRFDF